MLTSPSIVGIFRPVSGTRSISRQFSLLKRDSLTVGRNRTAIAVKHNERERRRSILKFGENVGRDFFSHPHRFGIGFCVVVGASGDANEQQGTSSTTEGFATGDPVLPLVETRGERGEEEGKGGRGGVDLAVEGEGKGNVGVAIISVAAAVALFALTRLGGGPSLSTLAAASISYDEALTNGRPTVVEFYADWCEVCREMTNDVFNVEEEFRDKVNFVMLNIDNKKWAPEMNEFGVDGIPHFSFLDKEGNEEGYVVGRLPRRILYENIAALASGSASVPNSAVVGQFSESSSRESNLRNVEPRTHG